MDLVKASKFFHVGLCPVHLICPPLPEVINQKPVLSLDTWDLEVGVGREEGWNQDVLENLAPGGLQGAFSSAMWTWLSPLLPLASGHW